MADYDLPIVKSDIEKFRGLHILHTDQLKNEFIEYKLLMNTVTPKEKKISPTTLLNITVRIQAFFRGHLARKEYAMRKRILDDSALDLLKQ